MADQRVRRTRHEEIDLDDEDEDILDRVWDSMPPRTRPPAPVEDNDEPPAG